MASGSSEGEPSLKGLQYIPRASLLSIPLPPALPSHGSHPLPYIVYLFVKHLSILGITELCWIPLAGS